MADFIPDGPNKLLIEPPGSGNTSFDLERDVYSAWVRWVQSGAGAQWEPAFAQEGGTPIGATGLFTGSTLVLINGWKLYGADHDHEVNIIGNLFSDDGVNTVPNPNFNVNFNITRTVGAQGIATGSGVTQQDKDDIVNQVFSRVMEGGHTFEGMVRLLAANAGGRAVVQTDGSYVIYGVDGTTIRIDGQASANNGRDINSLDSS